MGLIQIPGLGSRVSLTGKQSAWLDLISYSSIFLCHSAHLPLLFRVCSPVPLRTIFAAMKSNNTFPKAIGKSTWQNMHLLWRQNLYLGHCVSARTQETASLQPTANGISHAGAWHSYRESWVCSWDVECLRPGDWCPLCLCCDSDRGAGSFPRGGGF